MPKQSQIDLKLFAHILLDPELQGRYELQGNYFSITSGYLTNFINTYFKEHQQAVPEKFNALRLAMASMVQIEQATQLANGESLELTGNSDALLNTLQKTNKPSEKLSVLQEDLFNRISKLKKGQYILIPGGWNNPNSPGHAMAYQFTQTRTGLEFSIYNSGAGLDNHELTSSKSNERYYPVRRHHIAKGYDEKELKILLKRLLLARLPNLERSSYVFNSDVLYSEIDKSLAHLNARQRMVQQVLNVELTTAGQVSGTCAQRVLHQLLKITFGNLPEYQRFIFAFKMHALQDLTRQISSASPPSTKELVQLGISNITKLLREQSVVQEGKKAAYLKKLTELKSQFQQLAGSVNTLRTDNETNEVSTALTIDIAPLSLEEMDENAVLEQHQIYHSIIKPDLNMPLLPQMSQIISFIENQTNLDIAFKVEQLETFMISMPLPESFEPSYLQTFKAYEDVVNSPEAIEEMKGQLKTFQTLYFSLQASRKQTESGAKQKIISGTLIALYDFLLACEGKTTHVYNTLLKDAFESFEHCPSLATYNPVFDDKFSQLLTLYQTKTPVPYIADASRQYIENQPLVMYYKTLISAESEELLEHIYNAYYEEKTHEHRHELQSKKFIALYTLLKFFDHKGELVEKSWHDIKAIMEQEEGGLERFNLLDEQLIQPFLKEIRLESFFLELLKQSFGGLDSGSRTSLTPIIVLESAGWSGPIVEFHSPIKVFKFRDDFQYGQALVGMVLKEDAPQHNLALNRILKTQAIKNKKGQWSSNQIQIYGGQLFEWAEPQLIHELLHLRTSPSHQAQLTLNHFKKHIKLLSEQALQYYVQVNLFERDHLSSLLEHNPQAFLLQFDDFINCGIKFYLNEQALMTQPSLFFLQLRYLVNQYLVTIQPEMAYQRLESDLQHLSSLLELPHNESIKTSVHQYQFLTANKLHSLAQDKDLFFSKALQSLFFIQINQNPYRTTDVEISNQITHAQSHFQAWVEAMEEKDLVASIRTAMDGIGIDVTDFAIKSHYPDISFTHNEDSLTYDIDVKSGLVFVEGRALSLIPASIKYNPFRKKLGLENETVCFLSKDKNTAEFITSHQHIRVKNILKGSTTLEKKWRVGDFSPTWYTLLPTAQSLPKSYFHEDITVWGCPESQVSLIVKEEAPIAQSNKNGELEQLDENGIQNGYVLSKYHGKFSAVLENFETADFIVASHKEDHWKFYLPRYKLHLETQGNELYLANTDYKLTDLSSPFSKEIACLNVSNGQNHQAIVAVKPFEVATDITPLVGDYYLLKHNSDTAPQQIITYKIIDGKAKVSKPQEALYLSYLFLAMHQPEQCWRQLDQILSLECTYTELMLLEWITNKLPIAHSDEEGINNPVYNACKLKALALFTEQLAQNKKPVFLATNPELDTVESFYKELPKTIGGIFTIFQNQERHLSHPFFLDNRARASLLNTYQHLKLNDLSTIKIDKDFQCIGALGYQSIRLSLETLVKEKKHLQALKQSLEANSEQLPTRFENRLNEIEQTVYRECRIAKVETKLEQKIISYQYDYTSLKITIAASLTADVLKSMTSELTKRQFIDFVPDFLHIACYYADNSAAYTTLKQLCMRTIRDNAHPSNKNQGDDFKTLVHLLYKLLCADKKIRKELPNNIEEKNKTRGYNDRYTLNDLHNALVYSSSEEQIIIYQPKNVFDSLLADNNQILQELEQDLPAYVPMSLSKKSKLNAYGMHAFKEKLSQKLGGYKAFANAYLKAEQDYQNALQIQLSELEISSNQTNSKLQQEQMAEQAAGVIKFDCLQAQKAASVYFDDIGVFTQFKQVAESFYSEQSRETDKAWDEAIKLANSLPSQSKAANDFEIEKLAGLRRDNLSQMELLILYFHADETRYIEMTSLEIKQIKRLHQLIHLAVTQSVESAHLKRVLQALEGERPKDAALIASTLMSENHPDAQEDPALMLFQYQEGILLRARQCQALKNLLSKVDTDEFQYQESIEKVIMGGGKSKVLLPLLAQMKADGHSLVMIEVPPSLLQTNHSDLSQLSHKLFGQKSHCFQFSRESDCSPEHLEEIYNQFVASMINKDYWVTTGGSIQSLELKYLELLLAGEPEEEVENYHQQIHWMGKITSLVREFGDVIIDEVHQGLLLKKELNYSLGSPESIDTVKRELSIKLYRFLSLVCQPIEETQATEDSGSLLRAEAMRLSWAKSLPNLMTALTQDERSPLREIIKLLKSKGHENIEANLMAYLSNEAPLPRIDELSPSVKDTLAFYKEQLSSLLPHTLVQKHKVNYGPSDEKRKLPVNEQVLAVPYVANSQPSDSSDFSNIFTKINYTIQSLLIDGLDKALLKEMVKVWLSKARLELDNDPNLKCISDTPLAIGVNHCLEGTGFRLESLNFKNDAQMEALLNKVQFKQDLILNMLEHNILEKIKIEPDLLHSNALNHVDLYHSVQGVSGTPYNVTTFHQRLQFNRSTALGTDGYLLEVLKHKQSPIHGIDFTQTDKFIVDVFKASHSSNLRAIIDVGAMFTGIKNIDVAKELAQYLKTNDAEIQHVLYFNEDNVLCAFDIKKQEIIILTSSDPDEINQKLGNTPAERFSYYDQAHTVGADLKQTSNSTGIVLIDPKTQIQSFLQGAMRMRGLEANQNIEIIATPTMAQSSLQGLMDLMVTNEQQQLMEDNFNAAAGKMENIIRNHVIESSLALTDPRDKIAHIEAFKHYVVKSQQGRIFDQYGQVSIIENTEKLLEDYKTSLLLDLQKGQRALTPEVINKLGLAMSNVIEQVLPYCQERTQTQGQSFDQESETQIQKENQVILEQIKQVQKEAKKDYRTPRAYIPWQQEELLKFAQQVPLRIKSLNAACSLQDNELFTPELFISSNQALIASSSSMFSSDLKPVYSILYSQNEGRVIGCIISNEEARDIAKLLVKDEFQDMPIWLDTTQHTHLSGHRPEDVSNMPEYQILMEQVRFFNGEFSLLSHQETPLLWAKQNCAEKLAFYDNKLSPYRNTTKAEFTLFEEKMSKKVAGFRLLRKHAFQPLSLDWELIYPDAQESEINILKSLAEALNEANQKFDENLDVDLNFLKQKYQLSDEAVGDLKSHIALLADCKVISSRLAPKPKFKLMAKTDLMQLRSLMKMLSEDGVFSNEYTSNMVNIFFKQLSFMSKEEWSNMVNCWQFKYVLKALKPQLLIQFWVKHAELFEDGRLFKSLVYEVDAEGDKYLTAFLQSEEQVITDKHKFAIIQNISDDNKQTDLLTHIPLKQREQMLPLFLENDCLKEYQFGRLSELMTNRELKTKILLRRESIKSMLEIKVYDSRYKKYVSAYSASHLRILKRISNETRNHNEKFKQIKSDYYLKTLQSICQYSEPKSIFSWGGSKENVNIRGYKCWLSSAKCDGFFIHQNPPLLKQRWQQLENITKDNILDTILSWQKEDELLLLNKQDEMTNKLLTSIEQFKSEVNEQVLADWISEVEQAFEQFKEDKDMTALQNTCAALKQCGEKLESTYSITEDIVHALVSIIRGFFYMFDFVLSLGSAQTMAETQTPFAKKLTGRHHFFEPSQKSSAYNASHLFSDFEKACDELEALIPPSNANTQTI